MVSKFYNMKNKATIISICISISFLFGCKTPSSTVAGNYNYKTECLENKRNGTIVLKAWGKGTNKKEAISQAKKNALEALLFQGTLDGKPNCDTKPLVTEVNAYERNKAYFDVFFSDKGDYLNFIENDTSEKGAAIIPSENKITIGIVVTVLQSKLKEKMVHDLIIK